MTRGTIAAIACSALLALAGCGSGSSSGTTATSATSPSSTSGVGLKANTTPKFASPPANAAVQSGSVQIAYRNIAISPDALRVRVGSTITWTNYDSVEHNVISQGQGPQSFASRDFGENGTFQITALKPGVIHYECTIHPASMNGTIEIVK